MHKRSCYFVILEHLMWLTLREGQLCWLVATLLIYLFLTCPTAFHKISMLYEFAFREINTWNQEIFKLSVSKRPPNELWVTLLFCWQGEGVEIFYWFWTCCLKPRPRVINVILLHAWKPVMIFWETDKQTYSTYLTHCYLTERQLKNYDLDNFGNAIILSDFS